MQTAPFQDGPSLRRLARAAGVLYLVIIATAGFAEGVVRSSVLVPGDASATARAILESSTLFRWGLLADLTAFMADAGVAVLLYLVLRSTDRTVALLAAAFRLVAHPAIASLNLLNHHAALRILEADGPLAGMEPGQLDALALFALELHGTGYVIAGAFFGVHCALLGYLLLRSPWFPGVLGLLLGAAGFGYLFEVVAVLGAPALEEIASGVVVVTAGVGEVALALYLTIRGVRRSPSEADGGAP